MYRYVLYVRNVAVITLMCVCVCVLMQPMPSEALCCQLQMFSAALQQAVQIITTKESEVTLTYCRTVS